MSYYSTREGVVRSYPAPVALPSIPNSESRYRSSSMASRALPEPPLIRNRAVSDAKPNDRNPIVYYSQSVKNVQSVSKVQPTPLSLPATSGSIKKGRFEVETQGPFDANVTLCDSRLDITLSLSLAESKCSVVKTGNRASLQVANKSGNTVTLTGALATQWSEHILSHFPSSTKLSQEQWEEYSTDTGIPYEHNKVTGETRWKDTWIERYTDDGQLYYLNMSTKTTSWELPSGAKPAVPSQSD